MIIKLLIAAVFASVCFSLIYSYFGYKSVEPGDPDAVFTSMKEFFFMFLNLSLPTYLIIAVLASILIDKWIKHGFVKGIIYVSGGAITAFAIFTPLLSLPFPNAFFLMILGGPAALIYFFMLALLKRIKLS